MLLAHPDIGKYDYSSLKQSGLCLGADVGRQAGRGDQGVRSRADPDLRPGRGLHDLPPSSRASDHVAALESNKRHRLASCGRISPLMRLEVMDDDGQAPAARRARRDRAARRPRHGGLLQEPKRNPGGLDLRLASHRRHRRDRRGRLRLHRRSQEGHDHLRRLQRLPERGRAGAVEPSRGAGLRGDRRARREVGRGGEGGGRAEARRHGRGGRTDSCSPRRSWAA